MIFIIVPISANAQCPTISDSTQSFCDIDDPIVANLIATDGGNGIQWYDTASSTTALSSTEGLVNGEDYYADDNSGTCGARERVDVTIYGAPIGLNFQGVCVDDPNDATIADLTAIGNNVQWYNVASGGSPLPSTTILNDNTIYYADQENPDTGCRTSRLSVLAVIGVVPVPTGDPVQIFCSEDSHTVADLIASGADTWYATNGSVIPLDPSTLLVDGEDYFATSIDPPCESNDRLEVTVIIDPEANPGTNGSLALCESELNTIGAVDLIDELSDSPDTTGTWSGPFTTTNGSTGTVDITTMTVSGSPYIFTYTVDPGNSCSTASSTVTITISPAPNAGVGGSINICNNDATQDLFDILTGNPDSGGSWSPPLNSGTGLFDPSVDAPGDYTYTVAGTDPCPDAMATVTVAIIPEPNAGVGGSINICNNDATQDLFDILTGNPDSGGSWSPPLNSGTGLFDPSVDAPGDYTYTVAGTDPCPDAMATVTVAIIPEPNAGVGGSINICNNDATQDLFDILTGNPDSGGSWSPPLNSGTGLFDPSVDAPGDYTYTVAGTDPCPDAMATVTVAIIPEPNAGVGGSINICNNDATQDLFDILTGNPDSGGSWSPPLNSGTGLFDPSVDAPGDYTYTVAGTDPCPDDMATVTVAIIPEPNAGDDGSINICNNDATQDLFDILTGNPDSGGSWSPPLNSGTGLFDPSVDAPGDYTYTVAGTDPCPDAMATVTVAIIPEPNAGVGGSINICNNDATQDLFDILTGNPDSGGSWSPPLNSGTGLFDPSVDAPGDYTYTVAGTDPCPDDMATVTVAIIPEPNAGVGGSINICNNDATQDLFDILTGNPDSGGSWSPPLNSGTGLFDPSVDAPGDYTYTVAGTDPCPDDMATVTVAIIPEPNAGVGGSINICNNDATQDLFDILTGNPDSGGSWSPPLNSGTGLFDPSVDAPGDYTYTVAGTDPCPDAMATVTVAIIPEPNAGVGGSINICNNDATQDLFDILTGNPDSGGSWSPPLNSGTGLFDPSVDAPGDYTYTVAGTDPCPDAMATVTVAIIPEPNAGVGGSINICNNDATQDLFDILTGNPDSGGSWSPPLNSGTGLFDPSVDAPGDYTYTVAGTDPCPDDMATVTVAIIPEPNAGDDGNIIICSDDGPQDLFDLINGNPDTGGTWAPALASGTGVFDPNVDTAGLYVYTIGPTQCNQRDDAQITVTIENNPNASGLELQIDNICLGLLNTVAIIGATQLADGDYNIVFSLTGANNSENSIDITITNGNSSFIISQNLLTNVGNTTVTIISLSSMETLCNADVSTIATVDFIVFDNITPQIIDDGNVFCEQDEPTILDLTANIIGNIPITWYGFPNGGTAYSDTDLLINGNTYYASTLTAEGCESIPRLEVLVELIDCPEDIIIPDGFSPNGDTVNDDFDIVNLRDLYPNFKLEIYNRYGNILYKGNINKPNWDGTSDKGLTIGGSQLPVGVYFYILKFNDGNRDPIQGRVYLNR